MLSRVRAWPTRVLLALVRGYRYFLSPWLGSACRFEPTCSAFALQALEQHGAAAGSALTLGRLVRCHPWCPGGHDPVPAQPPRLFSRLLDRGLPSAGAPSDSPEFRKSTP
ncbi:MAG: membrane protein insertion efficiency factor YidD [Burkholderiales bacterium]